MHCRLLNCLRLPAVLLYYLTQYLLASSLARRHCMKRSHLCRCGCAAAARHTGAQKPTRANFQRAKTTRRPPGSRPRSSNAPAKALDVGRPAAPHKRKPSAVPHAAAAGADGAAKLEGERAAREGRAQGAGKQPLRSMLPTRRPFSWSAAAGSLPTCCSVLSRRCQASLDALAHLCLGLVAGSESASGVVLCEALECPPPDTNFGNVESQPADAYSKP